MFDAPKSEYLVPFDGSFRVADAPTKPPPSAPGKKELKAGLAGMVKDIRDWQRQLYAEDRRSMLLIFQAMDAAGKDGTIRHVLSGVNPAGCQVFSFKRPSERELDHDYLWRTNCALPERGRIGVFNRSYYEEVLVVRVHPGILAGQRIPEPDPKTIWQERFESMADLEQHLARNGTTILKFWLNVSLKEQKKRFLARIDEAEKNWKFSEGDVKERSHWPTYMQSYEEALNATSRAHAPWYAVPADSKPFMRYTVARIIRDAFEAMGPEFPTVSDERRAELKAMRGQLEEA